MARVTHRDFSKGLWLAGPRDVVPAGFVRTARGVRPWTLTGNAVRSRWGHQVVTTCPGTTVFGLFRFNRDRYVHLDRGFGRLAGGAYSSMLTTGTLLANGATLRSATMIPSLDADVSQFPQGPDHLFIAGTKVDSGGNDSGNRTPFKVSTGYEVTPWGIRAPAYDPAIPATSLQALVDNPFPIVIIPFETEGFQVDPATAGNGSFAASGLNKQVGSRSHGLSLNQDVTHSFSVLKQVDLLNYAVGTNTAESSGEDFIRLWVFCNNPDHVDSLEIVFDVSNPTEAPMPSTYASNEQLKDTFSFKVLIEDGVSGTTDDVTGTSDDARAEEFRNPRWAANQQPHRQQVDKTQDTTVSGGKQRTRTLGEALSLSNAAATTILKDLSTLKLSSKANTWTLLRIPKKMFSTSGNAVQGKATAAKDRTWAHVRRVRITATTNDNGAAVLLFDEMSLQLGTGMFGKYKYSITYKNSKTGSRSNPGAIIEATTVSERQSISLFGAPLAPSNLPVGVDRIEVWRTLGNGDALFKIDEFNPYTQTTPGTYNDIVADYPGMQEKVLIGIGTRTTKYMSDEPLPFDNEPPDPLTKDVAGPHLGSLWTLSAKKGDRGKLFFSPPGRPESIAGFILVSSDDDPLQRVIHWNGIYVWSRKHVYAIEGTNPFIAREIHGVPGTNDPNSVVPTPGGIAYKSTDGARLFNGASAPLIHPEAIFPIYHNEQFDGAELAVGAIFAAAFWHGEYMFAGSRMYCVDLRTGAWREAGYAPRVLLAEEDIGSLLGAIGNRIVTIETPRTLSDGSIGSIDFSVEVPGVVTEDQSGVTKLVQRVYFDIDTNGQSLSAILIPTGAHDTTVDIGPISTATRSMVEVSLARPTDIAGILVAGSLTNEVEIAGVYYDLHLPEQPGALT